MAGWESRRWCAWATPGYKVDPKAAEKRAEGVAGGLTMADRLHEGWPKGLQHIDLQTARDSDSGLKRLDNPKFREAFETANNEAFIEASKVMSQPKLDEFLYVGGLRNPKVNSSNAPCARLIEAATGEPILQSPDLDVHALHYGIGRTVLYWDAEKVQRLAAKANWDFEYPKEAAAYYWSARKFLEACVKLNLGIRFASD